MRPTEEQPVFELMVEQIECADFVLLNKKDLLTVEEGSQLLGIVSGLNSRAQCLLVSQSETDISAMLNSRAFKMEDTIGAPRWMQELEQDNSESSSRFQSANSTIPKIVPDTVSPSSKEPAEDFTSKYGLKTFIYRSRIPFTASKLSPFLEKTKPGVLRVKGFAWIAERAEQVALVSIAGDVNRCDFIGDWWATRFEKGQVKRDQFPEEVERSWEEPFGDRRQEIVFIGIWMDEAALRSGLDACQMQAEDIS
jgi:G3E family GTPase